MNQLFLQHPEWSTLKKILMFHGATAEQLNEYEASGNPVVFETNVSRPLQRLLLTLLPKQEGTGDPSPSNIRPLLPWGEVGTWTTGENVLDINIGTRSNHDVTFEAIKDANNKVYAFHIYGTQNAENTFVNLNYVSLETLSFAPGTYKVGGVGINSKVGVRVYSRDAVERDVLLFASETGNDTFTVPSDYRSCWMRIQILTNDPVDEYFYPVVVKEGESITPHPVDLTGIAPPVYGCSVDLTTGEVWGTHVTVDLHKSDFTLEGSGALPYRQTPQAMVFQHKPKSGVNWNKARQQQKLNCALIANPYSETTYGDYIGVCFCDTNLPTAVRISLSLYNALQDDDIVSICYEIETHVLLATLTPQQISALVGVNTVWSDADGIELTFLKKG